MLRADVVEAARAGTFTIWAVVTIDEALELLTGLPAGELGPDGTYPASSVNGRVEAGLAALAERAREFMAHPATPVSGGGRTTGTRRRPAAS